MGYVKLSAPPTIGNVTRNTGEFSTVGVGAAATTSALYVNATNRIGTWITGANVSTGADADGLFVDASFQPSANTVNCASIGLFPTFAPPVGVTITTGYGLYVAAGTSGGAGTVTTGYGLFVAAPAFGVSNFAANIGGLIINSAGTGTITTGVWSGTNISLAKGGTNASLVADNGGIFYSTATAGAILASTSTANQPLLSGASGAPGWSTATYPGSTTINRILYSTANNVIGQLTTANQGVLTTGTTGIPVITSIATNGQLIIGSTAGAPAAASLTAGAGISITPGSNSITIAATGAGFTWTDVTGATQTITASNGYLADRGGGVAFTLPASGTIGDVFRIVGVQGSWTLAQAAGQQIKFGSLATTVGVTGSLASTNAGDCVECVATNTSASTVWRVMSSIGNITVA